MKANYAHFVYVQWLSSFNFQKVLRNEGGIWDTLLTIGMSLVGGTFISICGVSESIMSI